MPKTKRSSIAVDYHGIPGDPRYGSVTVEGLRIKKGQPITDKDIPRDFPLTLDELAERLTAVPGMEVE